MIKTLARLQLPQKITLKQISSLGRPVGSKATMAGLNINSKLKMNSGYEIPMLGFGVYQTPAQQTESVVLHSFKAGYRHVDSAIIYRNEEACAAAIKKSDIPRDQIFFTSKIPPQDVSYERTKADVDESLKRTGLSYIDLILIHAPYGGSAGRAGSWRALVEAQQAGKVRSIGVSNYGVKHLDELEAYISELKKETGHGGEISVGQWEIHPWLERRDIVEWCRKRNVVVQAYCPIVRNTRSDDPLLQPLVKKYNKTAAQVLVRWSLQKGHVPLPKSVTPSRIDENADVYDFALTPEEVEELSTGLYEPIAWDPTTMAL